MKKYFHWIWGAIWIVCAYLYGVYITSLCEYEGWKIFANIMFWFSVVVMPFFFEKHFAGFIVGPIVSVLISTVLVGETQLRKIDNGPSIIFKFYVTGFESLKGKANVVFTNGYYHLGKTEHHTVIGVNLRRTEQLWLYVYSNFQCTTDWMLYREKPSKDEIEQIRDFAFLENRVVYSYHDYSMLQPDWVYYQVGYNLVYKAISDSLGKLRFTDELGKQCSVQYESKNYTSVPDTFLVFRNINENIDDRFIVCAPEVNTPENWAKISDYGYIFHYDVYSKEEIESQCPQIRNYVEKYKERMKAK